MNERVGWQIHPSLIRPLMCQEVVRKESSAPQLLNFLVLTQLGRMEGTTKI